MAFAKEFEYPVMLKAAMGGGGRGMRVVRGWRTNEKSSSCTHFFDVQVRTEDEMADSFLRASNEAKSAFGDGRMFVEK